jgi:hypothetical protein
MVSDTVAVFRQYAFEPGQRIRIEDGRRAGDWEVTAVTDRKVTLRCPISGREFEWAPFCYHVADREGVEWPQADEGS